MPARVIGVSSVIAMALIGGGLSWGATPAELEQAKEGMKQADRDLARAVATDDKELFRSLLAADAVFFSGQSGKLIGPDQIVEGWTRFLTPGGPLLEWKPDFAFVLDGADLGMTSGHAHFKGKNREGKEAEGDSQYMTTWRKGPDGKWRAVVDIGE